MTRQEREDRIRQLRSDPDFRALVECLRDQTPEQIERFAEYAERSDQEGDRNHAQED